jgi:hypothetical protein
VDAGGNVGVKTASPSTDFEVNGNAKFTTVTIGSSAALTGIATDAEAVAGTSTSTVLTPWTNILSSIGYGMRHSINFASAIASGTGAVSGTVAEWGFSVTAPNAGLTGHAARITSSGTTSAVCRGAAQSRIVWDKPVLINGNFLVTSTMDENTVFRFTVGKQPTSVPIGNLAQRGFGLRFAGGGELFLDAHDGTTLTSVGTGITIAAAIGSDARDFTLYSNGSGTVTLYINDVAVATSSNGPTGAGSFYRNAFIGEIESIASTTTGKGRVSVGTISINLGR